MPLLDKKTLDTFQLDNYSLDKFKLDAYKLDGLAKGGIDLYVKSMLHFNGTDGSTTFTDATGRIWLPQNHAQIDAAQYKFGGASALFDGTDDYIETADSNDFYVSNQDFTIDFWVKRNTLSTTQWMCGQGNISKINLAVGFMSDDTVKFILSDTDITGIQTTTTISNTTWHHIAAVRYGNTLTLYLDGINRASKTISTTAENLTYKFSIGRMGEDASYYFNGWIDEFRFSKGIARWTGNFTPPTTEY